MTDDDDRTLFEASFPPSPKARLTAGAAVIGGVLAAGAVAAVGVWLLFGAGPPGPVEPHGLLLGAALSALPPPIAALHVWTGRFETARLWVRVTPAAVEWERVWWGLRRSGSADRGEPHGLLDAPGPWFGAEGTAPVRARLGGRAVRLTPELNGPAGADFRAELADAIGTYPPGLPAGPWLTAVRPGVPVPAHPEVTIDRDRRGRATVTTPLGYRTTAGRWLFGVLGAGCAAVVPAACLAWAAEDPPITAGLVWGWSVGAAAGAALGLMLAGVPRATVRVTVGPVRTSVRTGWGPVRCGPPVRNDRVTAVATALHHDGVWGLPTGGGGNPDGPLRFERNPAAVLVRLGRWLLNEGPVVPLTGSAPKDGGAAFASAAAGAVAAALGEAGWRGEAPADWRFGAKGEEGD